MWVRKLMMASLIKECRHVPSVRLVCCKCQQGRAGEWGVGPFAGLGLSHLNLTWVCTTLHKTSSVMSDGSEGVTLLIVALMVNHSEKQE